MYLCPYSSKTCRMVLWTARLKSVAKGQTMWFWLQSWRSCAHARLGGPLALRRGQQEKQGCAVAVEWKGESSHFPSSSRAHSNQPAPGLVCLTWNDSILSQEVCSELWHWSLLEDITSLSYSFLICHVKWTEVICSSQNQVQPKHMGLGPMDKKRCLNLVPILLNTHLGALNIE